MSNSWIRNALSTVLPTDDRWYALTRTESAEYVGPRFNDTGQLEAVRRILRSDSEGATEDEQAAAEDTASARDAS